MAITTHSLTLCTILMLSVLMSTLLGLAAGACPTVSCKDLPSNVCARVVSAKEISLSSAGCGSGHICSATGLFAWLQLLDTVAGSSYLCTMDNTGISLSQRMSTEWPCYERLPNRNFANNSTVLNCQTDQDCKLLDGTVLKGSCMCGLRASNALGVCQPDYSADIFQGYWDECGSNKLISNPVSGYYWYLYMHFYPFTNFDVPCANTLFEIQEYTKFKTQYQAAAIIALAGVSILVAN